MSALYSQLQQIGAPTNYPPQKLKQGFGEHPCAVLKFLLEQIPLEFKRATYTEELEYEEAAVDEDAEVEVRRNCCPRSQAASLLSTPPNRLAPSSPLVCRVLADSQLPNYETVT